MDLCAFSPYVICNRCPEVMKLKLFYTPCWPVEKLSEDLCDLVFLHASTMCAIISDSGQ